MFTNAYFVQVACDEVYKMLLAKGGIQDEGVWSCAVTSHEHPDFSIQLVLLLKRMCVCIWFLLIYLYFAFIFTCLFVFMFVCVRIA